MLLKTRHFGEIEIEEKKVIDFKNGLPGFDRTKKFVIINNEDEQSPFKWLQSVDQQELAFVIVDPFVIKKDYEVSLSNEILKDLLIEKEEEVLIYSIVVVPKDVSRMTMNLQAPLIINTKNNRGIQLILDTDRYGVRHYILDELQGREGTKNASADKEEGPVDNNK